MCKLGGVTLDRIPFIHG